MLATVGLTERDVKPVLVPNVVRGADDFMAGSVDMFFFAFGAPKVREVDATVGGIRALEIPESGMPAARKIMPTAIWLRPCPGNSISASTSRWASTAWTMCMFTNAKVTDEFVYKMIEAMANNKDDLIAVAAGVARIHAGLDATSNSACRIIRAR